MAGATGAGLAKTGFSLLVYVLLAIVLLVGGLLLLRVGAVRRHAAAGDDA